MTAELVALALAALLQVAHWVVLAAVANRELGATVLLGPRDELPEYSARLGRLHRAFGNHYEALILFVIAVVVVTLTGSASTFTATCGWVFLASRVLYVPAYLMGLNPWRSVVWTAGFVATVMMIIVALL